MGRYAVGRYLVCEEFASGGMATVHFGRRLGPAGFSKPVAIKRLHPHLAKNHDFLNMFLDEARVAARIRHPNVVSTIDVVFEAGEALLVMEYVQGESLSRLLSAVSQRGQSVPPRIASTIILGALHGLHAAHEAEDERGQLLGIVHRDVSPQNILVGEDGIARVLDFGIAKAAGRIHETREGQIKGKLAYMAPEQVRGLALSRQTDVFAISVVLWHVLTGRRLFNAANEASLVLEILEKPIPPPSRFAPDVPAEFDAVVLKGLARPIEKRYATADEMAIALERAVGTVSQRELGEWVRGLAGERLTERARAISEIETAVLVDPLAAGAPTEIQSVRPDRPRRWLRFALGGAVLVAIGAAAGVLTTRLRAEPAMSTPTVSATGRAIAEATTAPVPVRSESPAAERASVAPQPTAPPKTRAPKTRHSTPPLHARE